MQCWRPAAREADATVTASTWPLSGPRCYLAQPCSIRPDLPEPSADEGPGAVPQCEHERQLPEGTPAGRKIPSKGSVEPAYGESGPGNATKRVLWRCPARKSCDMLIDSSCCGTIGLHSREEGRTECPTCLHLLHARKGHLLVLFLACLLAERRVLRTV